MANADGKLYNIDRWTIYTLQRLAPRKRFNKNRPQRWCGDHLTPTHAQLRRMRKKARKGDTSIVMQTRPFFQGRKGDPF